MVDYLVACSCGNDSIALIQHMIDLKKNFAVVYNDTGWARADWPDRVKRVGEWCFSNGITFYVTKSEGMESLVRRKKGWPMPASAMQFCTEELKERPTCGLLQKIDPTEVSVDVSGKDNLTLTGAANWDLMLKVKQYANKKDKNKNKVNTVKMESVSGAELTIVTGRRREESQNRANLPQHEYNSRKHGSRDIWNPLYMYTDLMRDTLIAKTPFDTLPHSSMECYPCVCANKCDLAAMANDEVRIDQIERIELEMGHTKNEKPRVMFRPYRAGGAVGIRQAVQWGQGVRGWKAPFYPDAYKFKGDSTSSDSDIAYDDDTKEGREFARQCDGGYCGN